MIGAPKHMGYKYSKIKTDKLSSMSKAFVNKFKIFSFYVRKVLGFEKIYYFYFTEPLLLLIILKSNLSTR